jgi:hypothetical protein
MFLPTKVLITVYHVARSVQQQSFPSGSKRLVDEECCEHPSHLHGLSCDDVDVLKPILDFAGSTESSRT